MATNGGGVLPNCQKQHKTRKNTKKTKQIPKKILAPVCLVDIQLASWSFGAAIPKPGGVAVTALFSQSFVLGLAMLWVVPTPSTTKPRFRLHSS